MSNHEIKIHGAGLGLRRDFLPAVAEQLPKQVQFMEVAPENWMGIGGRLGKLFRSVTERMPMVCHGLSLSIGGRNPLDTDFLKKLRVFLDRHQVQIYSEHLSYCADDGHLYDLMPIPFTDTMIRHVAARVRQVQDILERPLVLENVSYYAAPGQELSELEFLNGVLEEADCALLLDVNNIYVNSINHRYDPVAFLAGIPEKRIAYAHIAGHYHEAEDLRVDTHGSDVIDPVWQLLEQAYRQYGVFPTLLERDFNIPPMPDLLREVETIRSIQSRHADNRAIRSA